jgi:hypothetical protein
MTTHEAAAAPQPGDEVIAADGSVGRVDRVLRSDDATPRYIVVAAGRVRRRYPVLPCGLITSAEGDVVRVRGQRRALRRLPETLPLVT